MPAAETTPLVSILMPTYRRPGLLREALASAVRQTYTNLQIVVRDNGSGDETPDVVRSFGDPRVVFLRAPRNEGAERNGIECLRRAEGEYLLPLCDDDVLGENYVAALIPFMQRDPRILAAYGATHAIDEHGVVTVRTALPGTHTWGAGEIIPAWCDGTLPLISGINYVCRTSFYLSLGARHRFPDGHHSDNAVFMTAAIQGKVLFTDQCIFYYRVHGLNSVNSHTCQLRAQGDREFLRYLDAEVASDRNVNMPREEWPRQRASLQEMMTNHYYNHLVYRRLHVDGVFASLKNLIVYPAQVYGIRNAIRSLRQKRWRTASPETRPAST